jgi:hypothetical protein
MKGVLVLSFFLLTFASLAGQYQLFEENGKVGIKNEQGVVLIPAAFEALGWSDKSFSVINEVTGFRQGGKWGMINLKKEKITEPVYEELFYSGGEFVSARKKINAVQTKSGCLNLKGEIKIPFAYDGIEIHGLRAIVFNLNGAKYQYGLSDFENHLLLPLNYRSIRALGTLRYAVENTEKKFALFNEDGKAVTDFSIDSLQNFQKSYAIFYQNLMRGLIDREGTVKLEANYTDLKIDSDGKVFAKEPDVWLRLDEKNKTLQKITAEKLIPSEKKFLYSMAGYWGIMNENFQPLLKASYQSLHPIGSEKFIASKNFKMGVIDISGKTLIPFDYDSLHHEANLFRAFRRTTGWYLLDANGSVLTRKYYQSLSRPQSAKYPVRSLGFWGVVDSNGNEFVHCVFDSIGAIVHDKILVRFKGQYGITNDKEDWVVPPQNNKLQIINESRYLITQPDNQFIKAFSGEVIYFTPYRLQFEKDFFTEQLPDGSSRQLNYDGLRIAPSVMPERIEEVFKESEGMIGFKRDGRFGFVDNRGRLRVANRYDSIGEFHDGLAAIKLIGKWGYVDESDHIMIQPNYDSASNFKNGLCIVSRNKSFGIINKEGKAVLPLRYNFIQRLVDGKFLLHQNASTGLADAQGMVLIEPRFDSLKSAFGDWWIACQANKCGVISSSGMDAVPMVYDQFLPGVKGEFIALQKSTWKEISFK